MHCHTPVQTKFSKQRTWSNVYAVLVLMFLTKHMWHFCLKLHEQNFAKALDKIEPMFYNINQNKRAEHLYAKKENCTERNDLYDNINR